MKQLIITLPTCNFGAQSSRVLRVAKREQVTYRTADTFNGECCVQSQFQGAFEDGFDLSVRVGKLGVLRHELYSISGQPRLPDLAIVLLLQSVIDKPDEPCFSLKVRTQRRTR